MENANSPTGTPILGTDLGQYVGRAINDIHRDIIDIAQGGPGVQAIFNPTPLPGLNTPAAPFLDNATQTQFLTQWIHDSNAFGQAAITIENNGFNNATAISQLETQIQTFENNSNAFDQSQGGLWSARFWNESRSDGTAGTAANALIDGLQTHNAGEVNAAAQQLSMNAADVAGNNLMADGVIRPLSPQRRPALSPNQQISSGGGNQGGNQSGGRNNGNLGNHGQANLGNGNNGSAADNNQSNSSNHLSNSTPGNVANQSDSPGHHQNDHHGQIAQLTQVNNVGTAVADNSNLAPAHAEILQMHHFEHVWS